MMKKIALVVGGLVAIAIVLGLRSPFDSHGTARLTAPTPASQVAGPPNVEDTSKWVRVFDDEFNGTKLDSAKWVTCYDTFRPGDNGCTNAGNNEQEWYVPSQVSVNNGNATLSAVNQPVQAKGTAGGKTYQYQSGMISTGRADNTKQPKWSANYGYYVARLKYDGGQGVWPAFWLLPVDRSWPPEIDIMEHLGNTPDKLLLTTHWPSPEGPQKDGSAIKGPDFTKGWHTYAVNWQPKRIDWYVDGVLKKTYSGAEVPTKAMEMILNLAIGGNLPGNADSTTPFPRSLLVDYVRVYEIRL